MAGTRQLFGVDRRIAIFRQHPRQVIDQSAARDVGQAMNHPRGNFREQRLIILVHSKQLVA